MPRRRTDPPDLTIAGRIRDRRQLRKLSIRQAAAQAGMAHSTWARIERGEIAVDNRFTLSAIAEVLDCSAADLAGPAPAVPDRGVSAAQAAVSAILAALVETDIADPPTVAPRPLPEVAADAELACDLRLRCDYAGAARLLPRVLRELHAHSHGPDRAVALRLLTRTADAASFVTRYVGFPAEAWVASNRARDAARALEDPVMLGLAAWSLGHAATDCGAYGRALRLAETAAADIERHASRPEAPEMLGSLQMLAAFAHLALKRRDDAAEWARAAQGIADQTGDTKTLGIGFGPTNLNCWWISMEVDGGEPGRAVEIAQATRPQGLFVSRQASFYLDTARALARLKRDEPALRMLLTGERLAPQRVRASSLARETVRSLLARSAGRELTGLGERLAITA